jgi:anti-anti-sigma factor
MEITEQQVGNCMIAILNGRLDTSTAPAAEVKILEMLTSAGKVCADMAQVSYVSSAGLRVLLRAAKDAKKAGGFFSIASPQPSVIEVLNISGFNKVLQIYETVEAAAQAA